MAQIESMYELKSKYAFLLECMYDEDMDEQAVIDTLDGIEGEITEKAKSYAIIMNRVKNSVNNVDAEIKRLQAMKKVLSNRLDMMESRVIDAFETVGIKEAGDDIHKIKLVGNGGKQPMEITDEVPDNYLKVVYEPDKDKIRKDLEQGIELPFAYLAERGKHLKY